MKFVTPIGTLGNGSGLAQVPAGSNQIPQSLLNGVGRQIDKARISPSQGILMTQTGGGTSIDFATMMNEASGGTPLPFQVNVVGVTSSATGIQCRIAEGRIFGRVDWGNGKYYPGLPTPESFVQSMGVAGLDGVYPSNPPADKPVLNPKDPSQKEKVDGAGGSSSGVRNNSGTYHTVYKSGNAGSVTNPNQGNSGTYHTVRKSGNAGSIVRPGNSSGKYHEGFKITGQGSYVGGNAGSLTRPGGGNSGTYHTPTKNGNAGSLNPFNPDL